jgi:glucose-6-phosphate 1-epimerase
VTQLHFNHIPCVRLHLASGDQAIVALHGAQVLSWQGRDEQERLYVSPRSEFDEKSPIRGGIPLCFPQFNQRVLAQINLPKHGFARTLGWTIAKQEPSEVTLELNEKALPKSVRAVWPHDFTAQLRVQLRPDQLQVTFSVANVGKTTWPFALALHSYLRVPDLARTQLHGLHGSSFWNAVAHLSQPTMLSTQDNPVLTFDAETDRVYRWPIAPGSARTLSGETAAPRTLRLSSLPLLDGQPARRALILTQSQEFSETVVWNPGEALCATLGDMPSDGYRFMVCVEAAKINEPVVLMPGQHWSGSQTLAIEV